MNSSVLGLLANVLATSFLLAMTGIVDSTFATEGTEKSDRNQLDISELSVQATLLKSDTATLVDESSVFHESKEKVAINSATPSEAVRQQMFSSETEATVAFWDQFASETDDVAKIDESLTQQDNFVLAQQPVIAFTPAKPSFERIKKIQRQLRDLDKIKLDSYYSSPSMSVYIPVGYGADKNTGFVAADYQERTRFGNSEDGEMVFGVGLGDAKKSVGVVLSYTLASVSDRYNSDFGIGGFNVKIHRQIKDDLAVAVGMNGFLNIGNYSGIPGANDFENSLYGVVTKVIRTKKDINKPFSRVAVTAGIGNGQFRTENSINNDKDNFNAFGNVAVRVHPQASFITEWTGQDLAIGASIAPFKNIPLVITPAVRDITGPGRGASDGARFVIGAGFGFDF
ncbi:MAG: hypothetical protein KI793_04785 [Rivularia sp. (in: Bacteria)]|nr:hypothetical protein [Rivularia sp. MS3]